MKLLVTGSAGHLGEALMRCLKRNGENAIGIDIKPSPYTSRVGSIADRAFVREVVSGVDAILHTATLHKPHVGTHPRQAFVDTNITGTLNLLEEAVTSDVSSFVYTSTTSTFGSAMNPKPGDPSVWVTESLQPKPKNIYGITKLAAEDLCRLFHQKAGLPCVVLRTSRFFPEEDDDKARRDDFNQDNLKVNELLFRRVEIEDVVDAHLLAISTARKIGFDRFIISATTPFKKKDVNNLGQDAAGVLRKYFPEYEEIYARRDWKMFSTLDRVYDNRHAREVLGWAPRYNFESAVRGLDKGEDYRSQLAIEVGQKGYHDVDFEDEPYPVNNF